MHADTWKSPLVSLIRNYCKGADPKVVLKPCSGPRNDIARRISSHSALYAATSFSSDDAADSPSSVLTSEPIVGVSLPDVGI